MSEPGAYKCSCKNCDEHLAYPTDWEGTEIKCPHCGKDTLLEQAAEQLAEAAKKAAVGIDDYRKSNGTTEGMIAAFAKTNFESIAEAAIEHAAATAIGKVDLLKKGIAGANLAINPKMSLLYQGPGKFRKFVFEFPMIAKNKAESVTIEEIIKA